MERPVLPLLAGQDAHSRPTRWCCSSARRSTRSTCAPWAPRSDAARRSCPRRSRWPPTCITIGTDTIIRRASSFAGYHATGGVLRTGPVTIGNDAFVGEATVIDIDTEIGDGAQLGHSSSLHPGQRIRAGGRSHGVPAEPTDTDYKVLADAPRGSLRRLVYGMVQLLLTLVGGAAVSGVLVVVLATYPAVSAFFDPTRYSLASARFYLSIAAISVILFLAGLLLGLAVVTTASRLLIRFVRPGCTYRLYGARHFVASTMIWLSNSGILHAAVR